MNRTIGRRRSLHLFNQSLQPVFEFSLYACPSLQQGKIEGPDRHVLQRRRNIALRNAKSKSFHHRRLAHSRFARQDRIVLPAARQDVDDLTDFKISPQHGIDLSQAGVLGQVHGVLVEIGRLAASSAARCRLARRFRRRSDYLFMGSRPRWTRNPCEGLGLDLLELAADFPHQARQFVVGKQCENGEAGADLSGVEVDGTNGPGFGQHLQESRAECGSSRVP